MITESWVSDFDIDWILLVLSGCKTYFTFSSINGFVIFVTYSSIEVILPKFLLKMNYNMKIRCAYFMWPYVISWKDNNSNSMIKVNKLLFGITKFHSIN